MTPAKIRDETDSALAHVFVAMIVHGVLLAGLVVLFASAVHKFHQLYLSFDAEAPVLTQASFAISTFVRHYVSLVFLAVVAFLVGDAAFLAYLQKNCRPIWSFTWSTGLCGLFGFGYLFGIFSLFMPLVC